MMAPWLALVIVGVVIIGLVAFLVLYFSLPSRKSFDLNKKHVVVTGGSKGIGKQLAVSLLSRGCNVSIIARNEADLKLWAALKRELQSNSRCNVPKQKGLYATRCVVSGMKSRRSGHISFVSSAAGQCAIYGYTAYAPTKFALRGLADALQMELSPYNVNVSVLYPPNTDTEGYKVLFMRFP
ncbi:oxidoreductase, short chain dehydrogenase/reductase family protein [Ostertagia ostertagi]